MQELKPLPHRRFLLRNPQAKDALAIIEAESTVQALQRAQLLAGVTSLLGRATEFEAVEACTPMPIPTFLEGYFSLLDKQVN